MRATREGARRADRRGALLLAAGMVLVVLVLSFRALSLSLVNREASARAALLGATVMRAASSAAESMTAAAAAAEPIALESNESDAEEGEPVECGGETVASIEACAVEPDPVQINNIIQAGFSIPAAAASLRAVGNAGCCGKQIAWLHARNRARNVRKWGSDAAETRERLGARCTDGDWPHCCHISPHTDYDGIAVRWGSANKQPDAKSCCDSCRDYKPQPPDYYPCNAWVYCPKKEGEGPCFAPAAGTFEEGQCWLKYQDDPTNPLVNMKGKYTDEYLRRHPEAPEMVDWTAGLIVEKHLWPQITNGTWSPRAGW